MFLMCIPLIQPQVVLKNLILFQIMKKAGFVNLQKVLANYGPQVKSGLLCIFVKKVSWEHKSVHSPLCCFHTIMADLSSYNWDHVNYGLSNIYNINGLSKIFTLCPFTKEKVCQLLTYTDNNFMTSRMKNICGKKHTQVEVPYKTHPFLLLGSPVTWC